MFVPGNPSIDKTRSHRFLQGTPGTGSACAMPTIIVLFVIHSFALDHMVHAEPAFPYILYGTAHSVRLYRIVLTSWRLSVSSHHIWNVPGVSSPRLRYPAYHERCDIWYPEDPLPCLRGSEPRCVPEVVTFTRDIAGNLNTIRKTYSGDLTKRGVRLLRSRGLHCGTHAALLRCGCIRRSLSQRVESLLQSRSSGLLYRCLSSFSY